MGLSRKTKTQLGVSLIFLILGIGNLLFGHYKSEYYLRALTKAEFELKNPESQESQSISRPNLSLRSEIPQESPISISKDARGDLELDLSTEIAEDEATGSAVAASLGALPLMKPILDINKQSQLIAQLRSRLYYYRFSVLGGKCFLALAGVFLLYTLVSGLHADLRLEAEMEEMVGNDAS